MLKIWGRGNSTNVKKVLWCATELGLDFEPINAGGAFGKVNEAEYRALNPNGLVPCLQDEDLVLWESNAIVRYLAAQYGSAPFYGENAKSRASADKWLDWTTTNVSVPFRPVFWGMVRTPEQNRDFKEISQNIQLVEKALDIVEQTLAVQPYLSGEEFGFGDIALGCFMYAWFNMEITRQPHPHLERWYKALTTRPAYQTAVMIPLT